MAAGSAQQVVEALQKILSRHGSSIMAQQAVKQALGRMGLGDDDLSGKILLDHELEKLVEDVMAAFRLFCSDASRKALWIELVEFMESRR